MESDERRLIGRYCAGDHAAFEAIVEAHGPALLAVLRGLVGPTEAEDVFQETFLKLLTSIGDYREQGRLRAYLITIGRRLALDRLRRRTSRREEPLDAEAEGQAAAAGSPEEAAVGSEARHQVRQALFKLPPEQREVVLLHHYGGLTFQEIAKNTGVPLGTALGRMHYAMRQLKKLVAEGA